MKTTRIKPLVAVGLARVLPRAGGQAEGDALK